MTHSIISNAVDDAPTGAQALLDDLVHEHASQLATTVNNEGLQAQLEFLRGVRMHEVYQHLDEGTK